MKCDSTGKTMFSDKKAAVSFVNNNKNRIQLRAYPCPDCKSWHVTKQVTEGEKISRDMLNLPIQHTNDFQKFISDE
jgi:hypothetical protein